MLALMLSSIYYSWCYSYRMYGSYDNIE